MIDVIIPAYNCHVSIIKTLYSILMQENIKDIQVLIVDDCSEKNYDDVCTFFSKYMDVKVLRLDVNGGPGVARQAGLENTNNEYIVFIDADDEFCDSTSVLDLYRTIQDNDMAFGKMYQESTEVESFHRECLHGKMYRRSFLNKKGIRFNSLRSHEDNAFNQLYFCCSKNVGYLEKVVYRYNYREDSITNSIDFIENIGIFIESMNWLFKNLEKQEYVDNFFVGDVATAVLFYCYLCYVSYPDDFKFIFDKLSYLKKMYKKYRKYLTDEDEFLILDGFKYTCIPKMTVYEFIDRIS